MLTGFLDVSNKYRPRIYLFIKEKSEFCLLTELTITEDVGLFKWIELLLHLFKGPL